MEVQLLRFPPTKTAVNPISDITSDIVGAERTATSDIVGAEKTATSAVVGAENTATSAVAGAATKTAGAITGALGGIHLVAEETGRARVRA